jgi:hypothetical protein
MLKALALLLPILALPLQADALIWSDFGGGVDPIPPGWTTEAFVAQARVGNAAASPGSAFAGTHEFLMGRDRISDYTVGQYRWLNHTSYAFELAFDGTDATFTIGEVGREGSSVRHSTRPDLADFNAIGFRLRSAPGGGDRVSLSNLSFNAADLGLSPISWSPLAHESNNRWWGLSDVGSLSRGFTLAGQIRWDWDMASERPTGSQLAVDFVGAHAPDATPPIPEPGTLALLGTGILGFATALRRKAHRS